LNIEKAIQNFDPTFRIPGAAPKIKAESLEAMNTIAMSLQQSLRTF
jgi:hypothetical protein